jgi:MoaA/NifB/PqqE/SkfB family radical SAM enzyme
MSGNDYLLSRNYLLRPLAFGKSNCLSIKMNDRIKRIKLGNSGLFSLRETIALSLLSPRMTYNVVKERFGSQLRAPYPYQFVLVLTDRCNFACPMCAVSNARKERLSEHKEDMAFEIVEKLVVEAQQNGAIVQLFGGEPLLYDRLEELFMLTRTKRVPCFITTNGFLVERKADILAGGGLHVLHVSLDGWDEPSQKLRGNVSGAFNAIYNGLAKLRDLRGKKLFPIFRISTVITKVNFHSLDRICKCVEDLGVKEWCLSNYFFITKEAVAAHEHSCKIYGLSNRLAQHGIDNDSYFEKSEITELKSSLDRVRVRCERAGIRLNYQWDLNLDAYYSPKMPSAQSKCSFIGNRIEIYPDGRIGVCCDGLTIGNIMTDSIHTVWNSERMARFRMQIEKKGILPMCFRCCGITQNKIEF